MPNLEAALAAFAEQYGKNEDWQGVSSDLLLILGEFIDTDTISHALTARLLAEVASLQQLDLEDEEEEDEPDWLTNPNSVMARCHY